MTDFEPCYQSIAELGRRLRSGELSSVALTETLLARIEALDPSLGAFQVVSPDRALAAARAAQAALEAGQDLGPLHGIPYAAKDLFDVRGLPTTAGTRLLADNIADDDSAAVARLARAGMVLLGKTKTVQFAYGGAGINRDLGTPHNPWHRTHHLPGGSSSGSAVAVAAGLAPMALGSDTGGSVRIPAALCGITGLKTTVGQVSRAGVYPLSWSLDSVGPLARGVEDAALVYQALQGPEAGDETTHGRALQDVMGRLRDGVAGLRIGIAETVFWNDAHADVAAAVRSAAEVFHRLGAHVESMELPAAADAVALNPRGLVIAAEAYTVNRRFIDHHYDELDPIVAARMIKGRDITAADYLQATLDWKRARREAIRQLEDVDAVLCPTTPIPACTLAEADDNMEVYSHKNLLYLRNTAIGNILNLCGLSVPCGFTGDGLPVGLMIYARPFQEDKVLRIGHAYQEATEWHVQRPAMEWASNG
ncbi:MAG: amidase [Gammaproteobacteria bacterium]|nr:amidase [Gammaproteobacteria bacterium]NIM74857.1 amidase [Gammaproteobacteria bacterium]NIN39449.1 amidase [Gammaproteobacteria bacterium]NIO26775.1 amidase [Gammaproteobacteria bacterium]NIO67331.1 amidase [Gammaproteobacteria bacterium]